MSLPPVFSNAEEYFEECIEFLKQYQDLYWLPNTDILTNDLEFHAKLDNYLDLDPFSEDFSLRNFKTNDAIKVFLHKLDRLTPCYDSFEADHLMECSVQSPLSVKKSHEIVYLAKEIKQICHDVNCKTVVDLGSGLGYVDQQIYEQTDFKILGIENNQAIYVSAKERQRKYHMESLDSVKYIRHDVSDNSDGCIEGFLNEKFPKEAKGFCLMGLHACGDLTVTAINLFLKMKDARAFVVTPCCYHKMAEESVGRFKNFPLSDSLKRIYEKHEAHTFLNVPFLRMAAQPPSLNKEKMEDRVFNLLARAVLQVYATKHNCRLKKKKRKAVRVQSLNNDFESYAMEATTKGYNLIPNETSNENSTEIATEFNIEELLSLWGILPEKSFKKAAIFISLQNYLPRIFENFILYDRLMYLKENGVTSCECKKVVDEHISPKCLSLFAHKESFIQT